MALPLRAVIRHVAAARPRERIPGPAQGGCGGGKRISAGPNRGPDTHLTGTGASQGTRMNIALAAALVVTSLVAGSQAQGMKGGQQQTYVFPQASMKGGFVNGGGGFFGGGGAKGGGMKGGPFVPMIPQQQQQPWQFPIPMQQMQQAQQPYFG
ncbi:uncharacterized protein LOC144149992 [Haemaphysalis longicornis]